MQRDFGLLPRGGLSRRHGHGRRLGAGGGHAGADGQGFAEVRAGDDGPQGGGRGADDGDAPARLGAQAHGHFGLSAARRRPGGSSRGGEGVKSSQMLSHPVTCGKFSVCWGEITH